MLSKLEKLRANYFSHKKTSGSPEQVFAKALVDSSYFPLTEGSSFSVYPYTGKVSQKLSEEECFKVKLSYIASEAGNKPAKEEAVIIFKIDAQKATVVSCSSDVIYKMMWHDKSYEVAVEETQAAIKEAESKDKFQRNFAIVESVFEKIVIGFFSLLSIGSLGGGVTGIVLAGVFSVHGFSLVIPSVFLLGVGALMSFFTHLFVKDAITEVKAVDATTSKEDVGKELDQELLNPLDDVSEFSIVSYQAKVLMQSNECSPAVLWEERKDSENFHAVENNGLGV
jgi:hypothetical protein